MTQFIHTTGSKTGRMNVEVAAAGAAGLGALGGTFAGMLICTGLVAGLGGLAGCSSSTPSSSAEAMTQASASPQAAPVVEQAAVVVSAVPAGVPAGATPTFTATDVPPAGSLIRLAGDPTVVAMPVQRKDGLYFRSGEHIVNEYLPEGYPAPTPPGMIDLKSYPMVRRAEFRSGRGRSERAAEGGFWPLFMHIKRRDIAMTSPVEMDYAGLTIPAGEASGEGTTPSGSDVAMVRDAAWTMSFLYRTQDLGPTGTDGRVVVVDAPPVTVLAIGMVGSPSQRVVEQGAEKLRAFLAGQDTWEAAGDVRGLFYNGPDIPERRKWAEIQVPVRRRGT